MNSHYDIQGINLNSNFGLEVLNHNASQCDLLGSAIKEFASVRFLSEWQPVQMGWFTSSYCSRRSCIGY